MQKKSNKKTFIETHVSKNKSDANKLDICKKQKQIKKKRNGINTAVCKKPCIV